MLIYIY